MKHNIEMFIVRLGLCGNVRLIPTEIGQLTKMKVLWLRDNELTGRWPKYELVLGYNIYLLSMFTICTNIGSTYIYEISF